MKTPITKFLIAASLTVPLFLSSCHDEFLDKIDGIGEVVEATLDLDNFDSFENDINADIFVSQGPVQQVTIRAQENIIDNIRMDVFNGKWRISYYHWVRDAKRVKIYITLPTVESIGISGSGTIIGETPFTDLDKLSLIISGSGNIDMETDAQYLNALISGSGNFFLAGSADALEVTITGSGSINAYDIDTPEAKVRITGSGSIFVAPAEKLYVHISGSGNVHYRGNPDIDASISGSGRVIHEQ